MSDVPREVQAAAAYLIGDWTEEPEMPTVTPMRHSTLGPGPEWLFGGETEDDLVYAARMSDEPGTYVVTWDDEDGYLVTSYISQVDTDTYAVRMRDELGTMVETTRFRIDAHDSGYVLVDLPRETGGGDEQAQA
jgi:hypothetical protein